MLYSANNLKDVEILKKILIVPDSFKNSLSAVEVSKIIADGFNYYQDEFEITTFPFADGGEGSLDVIGRFIETEVKTCYTFDPFLKPIRASYLIDHKNNTAFIESAKVIGIEIINRDPDCYNSSSYGLGIMIAHALDQGVENIYLFLGGSATCDGGVGMAAGLGFEFYLDKRKIERPIAKDVKYIHSFDENNVHKRLSKCKFTIACDVENPLFGEQGASFVYARQKGANDEQIELLELGMINLGRIILEKKGKNIQEIKGSGSAGGIGAGGYFFLDGQLKSAFAVLSEISGLEMQIQSSDIIITGEGHIDFQSFQGKMISQIKIVADKYNKPLWLVSAVRSLSEKDILRMGYGKISSLYKSSPKTINVHETRKKLFRNSKKWALEIINHK